VSPSWGSYAGTSVVQVTPPAKDGHGRGDGPRDPSDGGVLALAMRTGFATGQGDLVRTILCGTEESSGGAARESAVFVCFLLAFALCAAGFVFAKGVEQGRNRYKLVVECLLIITAVVPPELPIQLSLAVRQSLLVINKLHITCTQPFRIPLAGKVDVVCFDKTGALGCMVWVMVLFVPASSSASRSPRCQALRQNTYRKHLHPIVFLSTLPRRHTHERGRCVPWCRWPHCHAHQTGSAGRGVPRDGTRAGHVPLAHRSR